MDKRNFLRGMLMAVLAGGMSAALPVSPALAEDPDIQRYLETISRQDHLIVLKEMKDSESTASGQQFIQGQIDRKISDLINYTMDNFKGNRNSPASQAAITALFEGGGNRPDFDTMSVEGLQDLLDIAVPVAVLKNIISRHRITFSKHDGPAFERFSNVYRDLIVA